MPLLQGWKPHPGMIVLASLLVPTGTRAQAPAAPKQACVADPQLPAFEVAAITPVKPDRQGETQIGDYGQPRFTLRGVSLNFLLGFSYDVQSSNFINAPHGLDDAVFDLQVQSADGVPLTYEALKPRMQQLLQQRFCLKAHTGTRQMAGYDLVIVKGGPKLVAHKTSGDRGSGYISAHEIGGTKLSMEAMASMLASPAGRPVQNQTGLKGDYDIKVQFAPPTDGDSTLPSIFTAVKEQLGLELKPSQVPVPTLTIEHLNLTPTEN